MSCDGSFFVTRLEYLTSMGKKVEVVPFETLRGWRLGPF